MCTYFVITFPLMYYYLLYGVCYDLHWCMLMACINTIFVYVVKAIYALGYCFDFCLFVARGDIVLYLCVLTICLLCLLLWSPTMIIMFKNFMSDCKAGYDAMRNDATCGYAAGIADCYADAKPNRAGKSIAYRIAYDFGWLIADIKAQRLADAKYVLAGGSKFNTSTAWICYAFIPVAVMFAMIATCGMYDYQWCIAAFTFFATMFAGHKLARK